MIADLPPVMTLRPGMTTRVYDSSGWTIAFGGAYISDGSHRRPEVTVYRRKARADACVPGTIRSDHFLTIPLPHLRFMTAFKLRRVGGMVAYRAYSKAMSRLCRRPR